jgi:predicted nuclease of restriction endonuclease-like (RecB) superfamily
VPGIYTNTAQIGSRIRLKGDIQRDFYAEMGRIERWSVWTLREKIDGMLYERTSISKKPEEAEIPLKAGYPVSKPVVA